MEANGYQLAYIISTQQTPETQLVPTTGRSEGRSEPTRQQLSDNVRRNRTAFTPYQEAELKAEFAECSSLYSSRRKEIADKLGLCERVVKVWFQNQRQKAKRERKERASVKIVATNAATGEATRVPPIGNEITEIPVIEVKTATRVTGIPPIIRDPAKEFSPQLIVRFSGSLPTPPTPPIAMDVQPQPEAAKLEKQLSEFIVVRSRDRPDVDGQPSATPCEGLLRNQQDRLQKEKPEFYAQPLNACLHQEGTPQHQQSELTYSNQPADQQHNWNQQFWDNGEKREVKEHWQADQQYQQEPLIQQNDDCALAQIGFHQQQAIHQLHQQEVKSQQEHTPCPAYLLQQELEAYSNQSFYGHGCPLPMAPPHKPLQEDIPQYTHFSFEDCINQFPDHHLEPQPSLSLDTSLSLEQEIEKYLANPIADEDNINISEFLDYIGMEPELGLDLPNQGAEKSIPDSTLAPPIDLGFNFDF